MQIQKLEALRGFAAVYVLAHHISSSYLKLQPTLIGFPFRFGQEGVLTFFLLSGFVIHYSTHRSNWPDFRLYLFKRARRIYPIFLLSLLLSYVIGSIGAGGLLTGTELWISLLGNVFMLQDHLGRSGSWVAAFCENEPLWSLSYEWWFYMMYFPINSRISAPKQKYFVLALSLAGALTDTFIPNPLSHFLVLFPVWWFGVEMAREYLATKSITLRGQLPILLLLLIPLGYFSMINIQWLAVGKRLSFITYPFVDLRYFISAIGLFCIALIWKRFNFFGYSWTLRPFLVIGSFSYALYVLHYPIILNFRIISGSNWFYQDLIFRTLLAFGVSILVERCMQVWINRKTASWFKTRVYSK